MVQYATQVIAQGKVKLRWEEPYVSEAVNFLNCALPSGVYSGFEARASSPPDTNVVLKPSSTHGGASFAVVNTGAVSLTEAAYKLLLREDSDVSVEMGSALPNSSGVTRTVYIVATIDYSQGNATTASYKVLDAAGVAALTDGYVVVSVLNIPNGATTILDAYAVSSSDECYGTTEKDRPYYRDSTDVAAGNDSPRVKFVNPGYAAELAALRQFGMHEWFHGGFSGNAVGNVGSPPASGAGAEVDLSYTHPPLTIGRSEAGQLNRLGAFRAVIGKSARSTVGATKYQPTAQVARDTWGFDSAQRTNSEENLHPSHVARSWFFEAQNGRSSVTNVEQTNAVLLVSTNKIRVNLAAQASLRFGNAGDTDLAPGDIVEIISDNGTNLSVGFYWILDIEADGTTGSGHAQLVVGAMSGASPVKNSALSWGAFSATTAIVRLWRCENWLGRAGDPRGTNEVALGIVNRAVSRSRTRYSSVEGRSVAQSYVTLKNSYAWTQHAVGYRGQYSQRVGVMDSRGRMLTTQVVASLAHRPSTAKTVSTSALETVSMDLLAGIEPPTGDAGGSYKKITLTNSGVTYNLAFELSANYLADPAPRDGDTICIVLDIPVSDVNINVSWDQYFLFTCGEDLFPSGMEKKRFVFEGVCGSGLFHMRRTEYQLPLT